MALALIVKLKFPSTAPPARSTVPLSVLTRVTLVVRSTFVALLKLIPSSAVMVPAILVWPVVVTVRLLTSMVSAAPSFKVTAPLPTLIARLKSPAISPPVKVTASFTVVMRTLLARLMSVAPSSRISPSVLMSPPKVKVPVVSIFRVPTATLVPIRSSETFPAPALTVKVLVSPIALRIILSPVTAWSANKMLLLEELVLISAFSSRTTTSTPLKSTAPREKIVAAAGPP